MRRTDTRRKLTAAAALAGLLVCIGPSSQADEWYPGLPDPSGDYAASNWANVAQTGLTHAVKARQFVRNPDAMVTSVVKAITGPKIGDEKTYTVGGAAYLVSPEGAPATYGYLEPMTVRTVGFGLMPIEATVQVSQRRENGYPLPLVVDYVSTYQYYPGTYQYKAFVALPTKVEDAFNVEILNVRLDGMDLELVPGCRTVEPAPVSMIGPGYTVPDPMRSRDYLEKWYDTADPAAFFNPIKGGQLAGTMTIPPFTGCVTASGDDLSAMMTTAVSGPGNTVVAQVLGPCALIKEGADWPLATGLSTPTKAGCPARPPLPYPARDAQ